MEGIETHTSEKRKQILRKGKRNEIPLVAALQGTITARHNMYRGLRENIRLEKRSCTYILAYYKERGGKSRHHELRVE